MNINKTFLYILAQFLRKTVSTNLDIPANPTDVEINLTTYKDSCIIIYQTDNSLRCYFYNFLLGAADCTPLFVIKQKTTSTRMQNWPNILSAAFINVARLNRARFKYEKSKQFLFRVFDQAELERSLVILMQCIITNPGIPVHFWTAEKPTMNYLKAYVEHNLGLVGPTSETQTTTDGIVIKSISTFDIEASLSNITEGEAMFFYIKSKRNSVSLNGVLVQSHLYEKECDSCTSILKNTLMPTLKNSSMYLLLSYVLFNKEMYYNYINAILHLLVPAKAYGSDFSSSIWSSNLSKFSVYDSLSSINLSKLQNDTQNLPSTCQSFNDSAYTVNSFNVKIYILINITMIFNDMYEDLVYHILMRKDYLTIMNFINFACSFSNEKNWLTAEIVDDMLYFEIQNGKEVHTITIREVRTHFQIIHEISKSINDDLKRFMRFNESSEEFSRFSGGVNYVFADCGFKVFEDITIVELFNTVSSILSNEAFFDRMVSENIL